MTCEHVIKGNFKFSSVIHLHLCTHVHFAVIHIIKLLMFTLLLSTYMYMYSLSASCVHVSALLHALVALKPTVIMQEDEDSDEESPPVTSLPCQWKPPRKRREAAMQVSQAQFEYGKVKKYSIESLETFDPRPKELRNTCSQRLPQLLRDVQGKGLCVSLLLD